MKDEVHISIWLGKTDHGESDSNESYKNYADPLFKAVIVKY